jgi:BolA protein
MVDNNRVREIETRLQTALLPSYLEVIDESEQHIGHAGYQGGGHHFAITISSIKLASLTRVQAHRLIYSVLAELMISDIHALRITILPDD